MGREGLLAPQLRLFAILVLAGFLVWVIALVRAHRLSLRDSLLWFLSTSLALGVVLFPQSLVWMSASLGIGVPSNALFVFAFVYVLVNLLAGTIALSSGAARLRRLTQECALLRGEIDELRAQLRALAPGGDPPRPH
jgi:hypothetical protein